MLEPSHTALSVTVRDVFDPVQASKLIVVELFKHCSMLDGQSRMATWCEVLMQFVRCLTSVSEHTFRIDGCVTRQAIADRLPPAMLSKREIMRCLKRYVVREIYKALIADGEHRTLQKAA